MLAAIFIKTGIDQVRRASAIAPAAEPVAHAVAGPLHLPDDPVTLVAQIAESLPTLDADQLERLAQALDELTEAVGLALEVGDS